MLTRTVRFVLIAVIVIIALPIFAAPSLTPASASDDIQRLANQVYNQGDMSAVDDLFAANYISHPGTNLTSYKASVQALRSALPDLHETVDLVTVQGNNAAFHSTITGTFSSALDGIAPTGRVVTIYTNVFMRFDNNGKIAEEWDSSDTLDLMTQLGVIRIPSVKLAQQATASPEATAESSSGMENTDSATLKSMFNHLINGNHLDDAGQVFAPDFVQITGNASVNLDGWKAQIANLKTAIPNLSITPTSVIAEGDLVAVRYTMRGTFSKTLSSADGFQLQPNHQTVSIPGSLIARFDSNGSIVQTWQTYDTISLVSASPAGEAA